MLHAVARVAARRGLPAQVSLDPWMGCGVGTCLGCVVWMQSARDEPRPHYRCACTEGPVFDAREVVWPGETASRARRRAARRRSASRAMPRPRLAVEVGGLRLKNPLHRRLGHLRLRRRVRGASSTSSSLGGLVSKGLYLAPRDGCATPRIVETPSGLLNAIGLQGVGVRAFVREGPARAGAPTTPPSLVNVCGDTVDEYAEVDAHRRPARRAWPALEINISCPNVKKGGMAFGGDPRMTARGRGRGAQGHAAARHPQAVAERRRHRACSRAPPRRRGRTRSPASTPLLGPRDRRRARGGRGWPSGRAASPGPPSAPSRCAWPGRPRARSRSR